MGLCYFLTARFSLVLAFEGTNVSPVWPPTGLAIAAVFLRGSRIWPGILCGAVLANVSSFLANGAPLTLALGVSLPIGVGNTLEAVLGVALCCRCMRSAKPFQSARDLFCFLALVVLAGTMVSATIGTMSLVLGGFSGVDRLPYLWMTWWIGDMGGGVVLAPFLLTWVHRGGGGSRMPRLLPFAGYLLMLSGVAAAVHLLPGLGGAGHAWLRPEYLIVPLLLWATFRWGLYGSTTTILLAVMMSVGCTIHGTGPFVRDTVNDSFLSLMTYIGFVAVIGLVLACLQRERGGAERSLRESESRLEFALEGSRLGIWDWDMRTNKVFYSLRWKTMLGYRADEVGDSLEEWDSRVHPDDRDRCLADIERHQQGLSEVYQNEHRMRCRDGSYRWILDRGKIIARGAGGSPRRMIGTHEDITERKEAEQEYLAHEGQIRQAQKLESIGTLAGGIAHDFNNILGVIIGNTELLLAGEQTDTSPVEHARQILLAANRARDLVAKILTFSRKGPEIRVPVRVRHVVGEAMGMLRQAIPSTVDIQVEDLCERDTILADPTQIHQIMMNLCTNAYHAMRQNGGILLVRLETVARDGAGTCPQGACVRVVVKDTGMGMEQGVLDKIFEPFFTTKPLGEGTGMGLAVVHGIVQSLGGHIAITSQVGVGTEVVVHFPLSEDVAGGAQEKSAAPRGHERLLVVDDEPALAHVMSRMLTALGYSVASLTSSTEALARLRRDPQACDLLLTDQTMPEMDGLALVRAVRDVRPDLPVLVCTGYSDVLTEADARELGVAGVLYKPLERDLLARSVREVLDGGGSAESG